MKKILLLLLILNFIVKSSIAQLAFPGAEGFGKNATGGRGGKVIYVTSLDDTNTEGTLRYAINQSGARTIMFKVSGTITLTSNLTVSNGNLTIAGQTAPGDGICLRGYPFFVGANNIIIRYMRFRMGDENEAEADALGGRQHENVIIDHCSVSWSIDEACSFYELVNSTVQWTLISESLRLSGHVKGPHGYGGIWGGWNASFHHNLMAHHDSRTPRFGTNPYTVGKDTTDYRNNVIYNWSGNGCYGAAGMKINMVNNYYKPGPATSTGLTRARICQVGLDVTSSEPTDGNYAIYKVWGKYYVSGNYFDPSTSTSSTGLSYITKVNSDNWEYGIYEQIDADLFTDATTEKAAMRLSSPLPAADIQTTTAQVAYQKVLGYVGCSKSRDSLDIRIINETKNGTAAYKGLSEFNGLGSVTYTAGTVINGHTVTSDTTINWKSTSYPKYGIIDSQEDIKPSWATSTWSPWPTLNSTTAPTDTDGDGMPDTWETAQGLNPSTDDGASVTLNGLYTNLEVYLNSLVDTITKNQYDAVTLSTVTSSYGATVPTSGVYVPGESLTVTAVPNVGYKFVRWEDADGNTVSTSNPYTFTITSNTTLNAVYIPSSYYTVTFTVKPTNAGTIEYATSGSYIGGTRIPAKAVYNSGYEFVKWTNKSGTTLSTSDSLYYILADDDTVNAIFKTHKTLWPVTTSTISTYMDSVRTGDTLSMAGGTYSSTLALQNGKIITLKSAGTGSVIFSSYISPGDVTDTKTGFIFDGIVINRQSNDFLTGSSFGNISVLAFRNDTIMNVYRTLVMGSNTTYTNLDTIEITNCFIKNCGKSGYSLLYPNFYVKKVIAKNNTLIRYSGESFFRSKLSSSNTLNFNFEHNTVFKWSKSSSYPICNASTKNSTSSVFVYKDNIIAEPYVSGQTPGLLTVTGGNLTALNNLIINYGTYSMTTAESSTISDLTSYSASALYSTNTGFQDTSANDFHILSTSPLATANTTGGIIGDPRWLKNANGTSLQTINDNYFSLSVYPNPFTIQTNIVLTLDKSANVSFKIMDLNMKVLKTIIDNHLSAGDFHYQFDKGVLSSGLYLGQLMVNGKVTITKLIIQ